MAGVKRGSSKPRRPSRAEPKRGDVFWVHLDPAIGSEIQKTRPAVIVSNDSCNTHGARVLVMPITSNITSLFPGESLVTLGNKKGRALGDQLRSIDKARLAGRIGTLMRDELDAVDIALRVTLAL
jgi:mRNA interferase MazF